MSSSNAVGRSVAVSFVNRDGERVYFRIDPDRDTSAGICSFCRKRVTLKTGILNLATLRDGKLFYPSHDNIGGVPIAYFDHAGCGDDDSYWLPFDRLTGDVDAPDDIVDHINDKAWSHPIYTSAIRRAAKVANQGKRIPKVKP